MRYSVTALNGRCDLNHLGDRVPQVYQARIKKVLNLYRHAILIEIADPALTLPVYLAETPVVRRGRPSSVMR